MKSSNINILFTSSGRRVSLIKKFKELTDYHLTVKVITADFNTNVATTSISDKHYKVSKVKDREYISEILEICKREKIDILIPLIDTELDVFAENKGMFSDIDVFIMLSSKQLIDMTFDKYRTYEFFTQNNIPTPKVLNEEDVINKVLEYPLIIKPRNGSSSIGVTKINNKEELLFFRKYIKNPIIQEFVSGEEYTVDVMLDLYGNIKTIVPRLRLETRAGEVSKGVTKKDYKLIEEVKNVVEKLPGAIGCITLQLFKKENGELSFIEINPRYGGGIPLSIEAGAKFPLWTVQMIQGNVFNEMDLTWKDNYAMLRYDDAVFMELSTNEIKSNCM